MKSCVDDIAIYNTFLNGKDSQSQCIQYLARQKKIDCENVPCNIGKKFVLKRVHVAKLHIIRLRPLIDEFDLCFGQHNLTEKKNIEQMTVSTLPEY